MLENILKHCFSGKRLVPKRNLSWLRAIEPKLASEIDEKFPGLKISEVVVYLKHGINSVNEIPGCSVCGKTVHCHGNTILSECSVSCAQKSDKVKSKIQKTCLDKYGSKRYFGERQTYEMGEHYTQKNIKNLDDIKNAELMESLADGPWIDVAEHFGLTTNSHSSAHKFMRKHGYQIKTLSGFSNMEIEVKEFVESVGFECHSSKKIIPPYELDIYIPEKKLAIEFDGLYWHSSGSKEQDKEKSGYHLMKTEMCEAQRIQLLHIFENEWTNRTKQEIWKSVIKHKLGLSERIYARKCRVVEISMKDANEFIENNHLQGKCIASVAYGLFTKDSAELVQVITLSKPRYSKGCDWELIRMCSKLGICVVGGSSKLLSKANGTILSYGNRRWCSTLSNVYDSVMEFSHTSEPCYWYVDNGDIFHRSSYMKHKLKDKLKVFDDKMTEVENCYANGLRRIWDCGNLVYKML